MSFFRAPPDLRSDALSPRVGVLLLNLGTPDDARFWPVRRYLSEFLSDRRVIEAKPWIWQPILQTIVLTTRPSKSAAAYARIWNKQGNESPLRTHTRAQAEGLAERLSKAGIPVAWGMRYGSPSVADGMDELIRQGCDRIVSVPLYPQYSATTTATANDQLFRALMQLRRQPALRTAASFPQHPLYIEALAQSVRNHFETLDFEPQMLVASFHGLPVQYVKDGDPYPAECALTTRALQQALEYPAEKLPLTFQSRFGPTEWLQPYTSAFVEALPAKGITKVAVITPGFLADCIETLDEIGNELREAFMHAGGQSFTLVPCLNASSGAIDLLEALAYEDMSGWIDPEDRQ